jgi:hypothetical protein
MRTLRFTSLPALLLLIFALPQTAGARASEQTATGNYQFTLQGDRYLKYVEFDAHTLAGGGATGSIYFNDEAIIETQDVDGTGEKEGTLAGYNIKADVDSMIVTENKAVLSGIIRTSSNEAFIGQRVLLTVEDNGDNQREPDRLTWGIYKPIERNWTPSDAELKEDPGVGMRWWATDAEQKDDVGYQMPRDESIGTQTFPVASYNFADVENGAGDIRVQP